MTINLNNYTYIILINWAICIGAFLLYYCINYIYNFKIIKKYINKITSNHLLIIDIISGIVVGLMCFLGIYYSYLKIPDSNTIIMIYLPILLVIGIYYKSTIFLTCLISILIPLIILSTIKKINIINLIYHFILCFISCCFIITITLLKLKNNKWINFGFIIIFIGVVILIFFLLIENQKIINIVIQSLFIFILYVITYFLGIFIQNLINKINYLNESSVFRTNNFYKQSYALEKINETKTKNHFGLMCLINFSNMYNLPIQLGNHLSNYIIQKFLDCFVDSLKKLNPIFFITNKNEYAFYIPIKKMDLNLIKNSYKGNFEIKRDNNDPLKNIEKLLENIPTNLVYDNNNFIVKFHVSTSIYGFHSNDNIDLIKKCRISFKNKSINNINSINLYNPNLDIKFKINYEELKNLQTHFDLNDLEIKLNYKNKICVPTITSINHLLFDIDDIKKYAKEHNIYTILLRWIAMQTLYKYQQSKLDKKLLVEYPLNYILDSQFNVNTFLKKINLLNIDIKNIIIKFDLKDIDYDNVNLYYYNNLDSLNQLGIKIYFYNFDEKYIKFIKYFKPNWISIDDRIKKYNQYCQKLELLICNRIGR